MSYKLQAVNDPSEQARCWVSIGGMELVRAALREAHLLDEQTPRPPAPPMGDAAALLAWQSQSSPDPRKVPAWKLASAEG